MQVHQVDCGIYSAAPEVARRNFPFSSLFTQLLGFSFGSGPASTCRSPEGVCSCPDRAGLKQQLIRGLWLTHAGGGGRGTEYGASLRWQRPARHCNSLRSTMCSPREVVPGSQDLDSGGLHRLPERVWGCVDSALCSHTGFVVEIGRASCRERV